MSESQTHDVDDAPVGDTLTLLLHSHRRFLAFLERRVGSREIAEEILQSAFAKAVEHAASLERETVVAWFYRVLKNSLIDYYRKQDAERRALSAHRLEVSFGSKESRDLTETVCGCFQALLPSLKPEYADMLRLVDLGSSTVSEAAENLGITANNASVRLHRARLSLRKRLEQTCRTCASHGCYDCTCGKS